MNLNINEFLKLLGVKNPTNKIKKHPKVLQILNYCNQNDKDLYEHNFSIKEESLIILIENIHSTETLLQILTNVSVLLNLDEYPLQLATFYNLYNPQILTYSEYSDILIDEEYLKYATKE